MKHIYLTKVLKSNYCKIIFFLVLIAGYFLLPKTIFYGYYTILGVMFLITFALTSMCIVRNVKEKIILAKTYKSSIFSIIAIAVGLSALQVCGVGAPICGATVGLGFLSAIFPGLVLNIFEKFAVYIIVGSLSLQLISLYFMNCFRRCSLS